MASSSPNRVVLLIIIVLVLILTFLNMGGCNPKHVLVLVEFRPDSVSVRLSKEISANPRRHAPSRPGLTPGTWDGMRRGSREVLVSFHDKDGAVLETYGLYPKPRVHADLTDPTGELVGGVTTPRRDLRLLYLPIPSEATTLAFTRSKIGSGAPGADDIVVSQKPGKFLAVRPMGVVALPRGSARDIEKQSLENPLEPTGQALPPRAGPVPDLMSGSSLDFLAPEAQAQTTSEPPYGTIEWVETLVESETRDQEDQFNIVILAEGFVKEELDTFSEYGRDLARAILNHPPFDAVAEYINIYSVGTASEESGVSFCSDPNTEYRTYFDSFGDFGPIGALSSPTYIGNLYPELIYEAGEAAVSMEYVWAYIVISNCPKSGGAAWRDEYTVFAAVSGSSPGHVSQDFLDTTIHELGHSVGDLADEYFGNVPFTPDERTDYRNLAFQSEVDGNDVWWASLAEPEELDSSNHLKFHHDCTGPNSAFDSNEPCLPALPGGYPKNNHTLGAFWGCTYIEVGITAPSSSCSQMNLRGCAFYRPSPLCKMKALKYGFCRVCAQEIEEAVLYGW